MKTIESIKSSVVPRWRSWTRSPKIQRIERNDTCPRCGAHLTPSRAPSWTSIRETAVAVFCGCLLFAILAPAWWLAQHWVERQGERMLNKMVWHEPLEDWNQ